MLSAAPENLDKNSLSLLYSSLFFSRVRNVTTADLLHRLRGIILDSRDVRAINDTLLDNHFFPCLTKVWLLFSESCGNISGHHLPLPPQVPWWCIPSDNEGLVDDRFAADDLTWHCFALCCL